MSSNFIKHSKYCYSKKIFAGLQESDNSIPIDLKIFKRISQFSKGGFATFQSLIYFVPSTEHSGFIPVSSSCIIHLPKRLGITVEVTKDKKDIVVINGTSFFSRLILVERDSFVRISSDRKSTNLENLLFLFNAPNSKLTPEAEE